MKSGSFASYRAALSGTGADFGGERDDESMPPGCMTRGQQIAFACDKIDKATADKLAKHIDEVIAEAVGHRSDDGEPVTPEWLESIGFETDPADDDYMLFPLVKDPYPSWLALSVMCGEYDGKEVCFICRADGDKRTEDFIVASGRNQMETRGSVRRLLGALGQVIHERKPTDAAPKVS